MAKRNRPLRRTKKRRALGVEAIQHLRVGDGRVDLRQRAVERELAFLDQPYRGDGRDQLHHRGDAEHRVAGHRGVFGRAAAQPAAAEHALIEDAVLGGGDRHNARHFLRADGGAQACVDVGESGGARRLMRERAGACRKRAGRGERHRGFQDLAAVWTADDAHRAFWSPYALQQAEQTGRLQLHASQLYLFTPLKLHLVSIVHDFVVAPCGGMTCKAVSQTD